MEKQNSPKHVLCSAEVDPSDLHSFTKILFLFCFKTAAHRDACEPDVKEGLVTLV